MTSIVIPSYTLNYDKNGLNIRGKNGNNIKLKDIKSKQAIYEVPAVIRIEKDSLPFEKAVLISLILHLLL